MRSPKRALTLILATQLAVALLPAKAETTNLVPSADTTLFETIPDNDLGKNPNMISGTTFTGKKNRALIKFDLAQIPAGATVTSIQLKLNVVKAGSGGGSTFALHRVLKDWGEGTGIGNQGTAATDGAATWNNRFHPSSPWATPGAGEGMDYASSPSATSLVDASGSYTFGSTAGLLADVETGRTNAGANFGWILVSQSEGISATARRIASREDEFNSPILVVDYTVSAPSAKPTISGVTFGANQIRFAFAAESNRTYAVEFLDSLVATNWGVLTNITAQPASTIIQITNTISSGERYFRIRTP